MRNKPEGSDFWWSVDFMIGLTIADASYKKDQYVIVVPLCCCLVKSHSCLFVYVFNTLGLGSNCLFFWWHSIVVQ
jgi:hypothetical protein